MPTSAISAIRDITEQELALSARYCSDRLSEKVGTPGSPSNAAKRWIAVMGETFWHIHHYCYGQILWQRAQRSGRLQQSTEHLYNATRNEYSYVIRNSPSDFVLLPEIYTRKGEVELRLSLFKEADKSFFQARSRKPDYWPAYSHWADFLINSGKSSEAKRLVESGLKNSPNSEVLRAQYRLLGGNPSNYSHKDGAK